MDNKPEEDLEKEVEEAIEEEKEHTEKAKKAAEEQEKIEEVKQPAGGIEKTAESYKKEESAPGTVYSPQEGQKEQSDYISNQEFYIKNPEDFDKIHSTLQEFKTQDSGMSNVEDSDLWEIEPETKKLKIRKMPRTVLDILKQRQIIIDYYKTL